MTDEEFLAEIRARRAAQKQPQQGSTYAVLSQQKAGERPLARLPLHTFFSNMDRRITIVSAAGFLAGLLAGFLSWGVPAQRLAVELARARNQVEMLEKQRDEVQTQTRALDAELRSLQAQLAAVARELRSRRERPAQAEPAKPGAIPNWR